MTEMNLLEAVRSGLHEAMARDQRVLVMGEDVGKKGGVFGTTNGLFAAYGAERVIDMPLAESGIVGAAVGAAVNGLLPVVEIQFADFIFPAMNQIVSEAARLRYRSNGEWGCPIVIRAPFGAGVHGALYHSQSVEAFFAHVPGLKVVVPSTPADAKGLLAAAIDDPDPVLFFEHKAAYRSVRGEVPPGDHRVPIGPARLARAGRHLSVFTYGLMTHRVLEAAAEVEGDGIDLEVIDLRTLRPLDREAILRSVRKTSKALIVSEDNLTGGVGGEIAALIAQEAFEHLDGPVTRLGAPDIPAAPYAPPLEAAFLISAGQIAAAVRELAAY